MENHLLLGQIEVHFDFRYKITILDEEWHSNMVVLNEIVLVSPTDDPRVDEARYPFPPPVCIKDDCRH